jgi:hypothetical protein
VSSSEEHRTPGSVDGVRDEQVAAQVRRLRPSSRRTTGRERHEEKITVYVSSDELVAIEQARLVLRAEHGIAVDRGRLVRESIAELLVDLDNRGTDSLLVRRLREP